MAQQETMRGLDRQDAQTSADRSTLSQNFVVSQSSNVLTVDFRRANKCLALPQVILGSCFTVSRSMLQVQIRLKIGACQAVPQVGIACVEYTVHMTGLPSGQASGTV
jgi:hypothetical protein